MFAKFLFAGSVLLLPMGNAFAAADLTTSSAVFTSADLSGGRVNYMDAGGVWNGTTEVSGVGDTFTLTIANTADGLPDISTDTAFDLQDIIVTVDAGFVLAAGTLNINNVVGLPACPNISVGAAQQQPVGAGNPIRLNIGANEDVLPGCSYELSFGLRANSTVTAGAHPLSYSINYDDNLGAPVNEIVAQSIDVNTGSLNVTKAAATATAITGDVITYNVTVSSTGSGGLFDVRLNDVLSADLNGLTFTVPNPPPGATGPGLDDYTFEYLEAGESVNLTVDATVTPLPASDCPVLENSANLSERTGTSIASVGPVAVQYDFQFTSGPLSNVISHDATSYCEFCGDGVVSITVQNPTNAPLTNITLREDLLASGLEYILGTATVNAFPDNPGIAGNVLTWNLPDLAGLGSHVITFGVRSSNPENLITAVRDVTATVDFDMSCLAATQSVNTGQYEVPIRQPIPTIFKDGRNYDAGQTIGSAYTDPVYGSFEDDVIWQVNVDNAGLANMEALLMNDSINGNFTINYICPTEGDAEGAAIANGGNPGNDCIPFNSSYNVEDPFGNISDPDDVAASSNVSIYYVGRILNLNTNNINTADISWGCFDNSPGGGSITVPASNNGITPPVTILETGALNTDVVTAGLLVTQTVTGSNPGQDLGSKGLITITLENQTGGSIQGSSAIEGIRVSTNLPAGYVMDNTYGPANGQPTSVPVPFYGTYDGFIDTFTRDDAELITPDPLDDLNPTFNLTSSTTGADLPQQRNMLRNGDIVSFTFGIVMIEPTRFDLVSDLDVQPEDTGTNTDPVNALPLTNTVDVVFDSVDTPGPQGAVRTETFNYNSDPEDLDLVITDALYILTNDPGTPLDLNVDVINNGGHDADDYTVYVTLGQAMTVTATGTPAGCVAVTPPVPPNAQIQPLWNQPSYLPNTAAVFACYRGVIEPSPAVGSTETITFTVIKAASSTVDDDLTFRADVVGEVTLFDGTALTFSGTPASPNLTPPSLPNTTPNQQLANNYTLDALRSRVLGFNLTKSVLSCAESPDFDIQIGEDCTYHIESGGWFGFLTPGFTLIAVENVAVTDDLPNDLGLFGQGFIPFGGTPYDFTGSTTNISLVGANGGATTTPLDANDITWNFNATGDGIIIKDEFFRVDLKTRLLNNPVDGLYPVPGGYAPNLHGNISTNIARTSFDAIFNSAIGDRTIVVNDSVGIPGYPVPAVRTVNQTEVEPNLIVTKQVCNEDLNGFGTGCAVFADTINDGDTNDSYIYRITLENQTSATVRSPAFNIISTDTLDASDLMLVVDFAGDGLDNDGDTQVDEADEATLFASIPDNIVGNGTPAVITVNEIFNTSLLQVDPGPLNRVTFYYRVDPDITIAPLQTLTNTVSMSYDSLDGDFGSQNDPQIPNADPRTSGRARIYTSIAQTADVTMIPLVALPKLTVTTSNTPVSSPQNVSIGEEVRYLLVADLPVANLRQLIVRDELPAGTSCVQLQDINLSQGIYAAAGFVPGGPPVSTTCSGQIVEWNFGNQIVTAAGGPGTRFNFPVTFVARVDNLAANFETVTLTNGGGTLNTTPPPSLQYCTGGVGVCYVNDVGAVVAQDFLPVDIVVREPVIVVTKSFLPVVNSDAADILTVTVTATNTGTAAAYNLQLMDNLIGSDMTYIVGNDGGPNQPDRVDTSVANRPIFSWTPPPVPPAGAPPQGPDYEILPGATKTFTFQVRVDTTAQPLEILDNTIEAKWDSLPHRYTTLNTILVPPEIGPDGSATGLRNGAVPNLAAAPNIYETLSNIASTSVLPLDMSKTDLSSSVVPAVVPTIGAHRNFEVVIDLPEGTTNNLIVDDELVFGGISYVLSRIPGFDITYTFVDIISINGQLSPTEADFRGATAGPPTLPVDGDSGTITWDIGTVITDEEDDQATNAVNPRIIINYFARPDNEPATIDGVTLQNSATVNYDHGEGGAAPFINDTTAIQTVVEPVLAIGKMVTNITNLSPGGPVAGDVLEYQISINNTGNSTAFDSNIVDTLDANLLFDASFTPTALLNGSPVLGFVATPAGAPTGPLIWGRGNTPVDNTLDIPVGPGQTLVLTYRTVVQNSIEANSVISNSALVDWTSLDDTDPSSAFERTGAGCPTVVAPDLYCSAPAVANITADDSNSIAKTVINDTWDNPLDGIVRIGDIVTYQLDVNIQQGTTATINVADLVPAGLTFVEVVSINGDTTAPYAPPASGVGSNFSYITFPAIPAGNVPAALDIGPIFNWNLGTITNDAAGDATTDTMVIIYRARVTKDAGIPHVDAITLTNTADLTYIDGIGDPSPPLNDTADIFVRQPIMGALTKTDRLFRPSGLTVDVATDVMEFQLHSCNTAGLAPAYDLLVVDTLPTQMDEATIAGPANGALVPDVLINGVLTAVTNYVYTPPAVPGGTMQFRFITPIDIGDCVDINFNMGFYTNFPADQTWSNTVAVNEYYSLLQPEINAQLYPALAPVDFDMNNLGTVFLPPEKTMDTPDPASPEATIGDVVIYHIAVPESPANAVMYDVNITDTLHPSLVYAGASDISGNGFVITDDTVLPFVPGGMVDLVIPQIPAGQQAIIELRARVDNNPSATNTPPVTFVNTATYRFANAPGNLPLILGGTDSTASSLSIVEPFVAVNKTFVNITKPGPPDAGDILRYSVDLTASGGGVVPADFFTDAFDVSIDDALSLGLLYSGNATVSVGTIDPPVTVGDGITTPQSLSWSLAQGNADIDVIEGTTVTVTYDVVVLDSVLANQNLSNTVDIQWSSRDGPDVNQRDGSGVPLENDYFNLVPAQTLQTTPDNNVIAKLKLSDTFNPADNIVRIGDIVEYELRINMQEGTSPNFVIQDTLAEGLIFEQTVSVNGQTIAPYPAVVPFTHAAIPAPAVAGDPATGPTTVTWSAGDVINAGDNLANDDFVIIYRARVLNLALPQINNTPLPNVVNFDYTMSTGTPPATIPAPTKTDNELLDLQQPDLSVTKTSVPIAGSVIGAGDLVTYTVEILNSGAAIAYDTELLDTIPFGLRSPAINVISTTLQPSNVVLPNLAPVYNQATGTANWNFDTGTADQYNIPAGERLRIEYQVQADAGLGTGLTLTNAAQVQFYYSFDNDATPSVPPITGVREIYGPSNIAQVTLTTTPANALLKVNPAELDASIGETFTYRITVPEVLQATALYDVQILDDLTASAADLMFVSVAAVGNPSWTPINNGTVTDNLIIEDVTNGIDIPANTQAVIEITVTLRDSSPPNDAPLPFSNAATYTFNQIDGDNGTVSNGSGNTTPVMTIVEPDLTIAKDGPAGMVNFLAPIPYTLVVENVGTGPAFDTTVIDRLPSAPDNPPLTGGTCDTAPINIDANIFANDGTTLIQALTQGTHYTATYTAAPTCELVITTITNDVDPVSAAIEATQKLIVTYDATLNVGTQSGALLTNTAGATRWFSLDTAGAGATGEIREYTSVLTDSFTVTVDAPVLDIQKTVTNVTTGQLSGANASPSDVLRYSIRIQNLGPTALPDFVVRDEVDALAPVSGFFAGGTMGNFTIPVGADNTNTNINGGANSAGLLDVRSLSIGAAGDANDTILVEFDVTLLPVIDSGTVVLNQAQLESASTGILLSDDPNQAGVIDPTPTLITSAPAFIVQKTSLDITGDPAVLLAGDTLRYTLTVENTGQENSINSLLSDQLPANTTYVANSTRLNTVVVADPAAGISPLAAGMLINAPQNATAGVLQASVGHVATVTFDVVVSLTAVNGTIISNQGFFNGAGAGSGVFPQQPSDDPATALVDDPTLDVVGSVPVVDALKTVVLQIDADFDGIVSAGDTLRYTITTSNIGALPATNAVLTDPLPNNTTYVGNSTTLNGIAVPDVTVNVLPLILGIDISTSDLPPPLPGAGVLTAGQSAVVIFDVVINAGTLAGTIISNQGSVATNELPDEPTDADGIDANGDQPTVIAVGNVQQLTITKQVSVIGGGAALAGSELEYVVRVTNIGSITATDVVITDDMKLIVVGQNKYVPDSGLLDGLVTGVAFDSITEILTATVGDLPAAAVTELRFRVTLDAALNIGDTVENTADVSWNTASQTESATVIITIGGVPGTVNLSGQVWDDVDFNNEVSAGELLLQDYRVEIYRNNILLANILTDTNGVFAFTGLPPNTAVDPYELRYFAPGATGTTASLGKTNTVFTEGPQRITGIFSAAGTIVQDLNLPRQVNGIIYDSVLRSSVAGVRLTMFNNNSADPLPVDCFDDPVQQNQVTLADGYYKFDLNFSDPACPAPSVDPGVEYEIRVQPPASGFIGTTSAIIPPVTGNVLDVSSCPGVSPFDKIPTTAEHCENSASNVQAPVSVDPRTAETEYHLTFKFDGIPVSQLPPPAPLVRETNQIYNNHIPVDSELGSVVGISKIAGKLNVVRSDLVPYTITFNNTLGVPLPDVTIIDNFPAGFKYVAGSARVDGVEVEPEINGRLLTWTGLGVDISGSRVIKLLLVVGSGVGEGEYVNTAQAINSLTGESVSGVATATVRVIPDPSFDCTDIIGKVFDDKNLNAYQDEGERGVPGVQVATARGLRVTTDSHGRFHITCAVVANEVRGSNFIMKLDDRTLPSGYRVTTENPRVQRATRGKMMKFNFGTAIHRVVRLDLADGVFEKASTELRPQWRSRIDLLITELQKEGSILRLSYLAENESEDDVDDRLDAIEDLVSDRWEDLDCCYKLTIEKEVFWRKGGPDAGREFE